MSQQLTDWSVVDDWWELAGTHDTDTLADLHALLEEVNEQWRESPACFDRDPLCAAWRDNGPLRTTQEENWSQWLAHLCHTAPTHFITRVFDIQVTENPARVRCEVPLSSDATHDRRVDVLIQYPDTGISIEVKIDDDHYAKTPETAGLIERHDRKRTWHHYLLLPATNHGQLQANTRTRLDTTTDARAVLRGSQSNEADVTVLYWRDISRALRQTLLSDASATPHWQATAYTLITIIETVLCQFATEPLLASHTSAETVGFGDQTQLRNTPLATQYDYLTNTHTHE
ncbi:hypothetical protein [Natronorarus salvus]|uniref:hypothetical protein n=1 Tax=Natronorarus salvus TaxID=3117733 RepID=UPI002F268149